MKQTIILLFALMLLASCGTSQQEISDAKQKLLMEEETTSNETVSLERETPEAPKETSENKKVQIIPQDSLGFLNFDTISESSLETGEVKISGTTNKAVDKIQVLFSNPTSSYPDDDYTLKAFKSGDDAFRYMAASRHQVLDFGENNYVFRAFSGDEVSETKVVLHVPSEEEKEVAGTEKQLIWKEDNTVLVNLPTSSKYGEPMRLGESSFTYTQIKGLEIDKQLFPSVACEGVTDFIKERINTWFYWNTCRDIIKEKGIKFNVIRLDGENYIYERHYLDFVHGFYGTYELERGSGVTSENIAEKNDALKEQEFPSIEIVDDLMKDIVASE